MREKSLAQKFTLPAHGRSARRMPIGVTNNNPKSGRGEGERKCSPRLVANMPLFWGHRCCQTRSSQLFRSVYHSAKGRRRAVSLPVAWFRRRNTTVRGRFPPFFRSFQEANPLTGVNRLTGAHPDDPSPPDSHQALSTPVGALQIAPGWVPASPSHHRRPPHWRPRADDAQMAPRQPDGGRFFHPLRSVLP